MIKLKTIKLQNFQKHKNLTIDFEDDINLITGLSNKGKSCVRRAIDWVIFCLNISEKDLRKEGTKTTTVTLTFNNDVEVEKTRSASINRYVLRKDNEEQVFDSFGKETPEEIRNAIGMSEIDIEKESINLNIAEQLTLPFLLDKSPSFRAKLFNKLTGNELLDTLFKKCNKESLRIGRELKSTEELLVKQENDVVEYSETYRNDKKTLESVTSQFEIVKKKSDLLDKIVRIESAISNNALDIKIVKDELSAISIIDEESVSKLQEKVQKYTRFAEINTNIQNFNKELSSIELKSVPDIDCTDLLEKAERLDKLKYILNTYRANTDEYDILKENIIDVINTIDYDRMELEGLWKKCDTCPLCKGKVNHE